MFDFKIDKCNVIINLVLSSPYIYYMLLFKSQSFWISRRFRNITTEN
jgi:hypothetical protein